MARRAVLSWTGACAVRMYVPRGYIRVHTVPAAGLTIVATRAGGDVDVERCVPELVRQNDDGTVEGAEMARIINWPANGARILVYVSARSAASARHQRLGASRKCGVAAAQGDKDKVARYGRAVWRCIVEARGRLSAGGEERDRVATFAAMQLSADGRSQRPYSAAWLRSCNSTPRRESGKQRRWRPATEPRAMWRNGQSKSSSRIVAAGGP